MRFVLYHTEKTYQQNVADAFSKGFDALLVSREDHQDLVLGDMNAVIGIMPASKKIFGASIAAGRHAVIIDKSYFRHSSERCVRLSVDRFHPIEYLLHVRKPGDRLLRFGALVRKEKVDRGRHILIAGSSQKYCTWHGLGDATEYARSIVDEIRRHTDRPIIYRPKPSWKDAVPIPGTKFSYGEDRPFSADLESAHAVVGWGTNAMVEALVQGVPTFNVGPRSVVWPLCNLSLDALEAPAISDQERRQQYLSNVAYCSWSLQEIATGKVLPHLMEQLEVLNA